MKYAIVGLIFVFSAFSGSGVFAHDFGESFYNETPLGLAEYSVDDAETQDIAMDDIAKELGNIMPAAGEEADVDASPEEVSE